MDRTKSTGGAAVAVGLALGGLALGSVLSAKTRKGRASDDAPGFAARRGRFGDYDVVGRTVTIRKPRTELFAFWRDFENLPAFMENLEKIEVDDAKAGTATWHIKAPAGRTVAVKTEVVSEKDGELIAWRSVEGSDIDTEGRVTFKDAPGERGTRVGLIVAYKPPAGELGRAIAKMFLREPEIQARHDLKRFKMLMEAGEIATSARTPDQTRAAKQENAA
ncbi:SRPBCC family protein [Tsuneonella amylolytica]|uniref:SRPBCC family protein n=1 Tax=Tsuneonella amylolytica TaxID=2338327 RepID=UPI000EA8482B|nr:SRPBCC family protein [Tsuneonella amylolytica]